MASEILGIGNALLDFQVKVPHSFLEERKLAPGSMTLVDMESQSAMINYVKEEIGRKRLHITSGGSAANTLAGVANFGAKADFIGKVATDKFGSRYSEDLRSAGVNCDLKAEAGHTGTCLALITPDAERTMLTHLGAAINLSKSDIQKEQITSTKILYIEGYLWDSPSAREACIEAIKIAKDAGVKVAFTYSDAFCVDRYRDDFVDLTKNYLDIVFCNEAEAKHATDTADVVDAFHEMRSWCDTVAITCGAHGVLLSNQKENRVEELPTWSIKLIDKIGAGDLFAAGMLYGLVKELDLTECGYLGCYAATRIVQQMSTRLNCNMQDLLESAMAGPKESEIAQSVLKLRPEEARQVGL